MCLGKTYTSIREDFIKKYKRQLREITPNNKTQKLHKHQKESQTISATKNQKIPYTLNKKMNYYSLVQNNLANNSEDLDQFINQLIEENSKLHSQIKNLETELQNKTKESENTIQQLKNSKEDYKDYTDLKIGNSEKDLKRNLSSIEAEYRKEKYLATKFDTREIGPLEEKLNRLESLHVMFVNFFGKFDQKFYTYVKFYEIENIKKFLIKMNQKLMYSRPVSPLRTQGLAKSSLSSPFPQEKKSQLKKLNEKMLRIEKGVNYLMEEHRKQTETLTAASSNLRLRGKNLKRPMKPFCKSKSLGNFNY